MRNQALMFTALALAAALAGCSKSSNQSQNQNAPATASEQPAAPAPAAPSAADLKAAEAKLPAPYNTADLDNGQAKFALCSSCHTIAAGGPSMTGPNLHGVVGRKAGTGPGYTYSEAMKNAGFTWDGDHLEKWLAGPSSELPGTKMTFAGLKDPKDRTDVIAYLMVNS